MSRRFLLTMASLAVTLGSVVFLAGPAAVSAGAAGKPSVFKARIGWFYTDSPDFSQTKVNPLILHWGSCATAGGVHIVFPSGAHLYEGDEGEFNKPPVALLSGPPLNASDPFKAILYVGDLAKPGTKTLTVKCQGLVHGKLKTLFTGPLKTEYIRQDNHFTIQSSLVAFNLLDLFGTEPTTASVLNRSCSEPGTPSITLTSPALSSATVPLSDELGTFEGLVTPNKEASPGNYETVVSCGSGRVGVGNVAIH